MSKEIKHVPGPYSFHCSMDSPDTNLVTVQKGKPDEYKSYRRTIGAGDTILAEMYSFSNSDQGWPTATVEDVDATAHLFIAAPDLLKAAGEIVNPTWLPIKGGGSIGKQREQKYQALRDAIAKAKRGAA